jgi:F-type H+-transporting ATPase subunit a
MSVEAVHEVAGQAVAHAGAHTAAHAPKAQEGLKEVANWITLVSEKWHGAPWADFLHHWENVVFAWTIALGLILLAFFGTRRRKDIPGPLQNFLETIAEGVDRFITDVLGERGRKFVPFLGTLFLYILCQNLIGIVPGMKSPTSSLNTTVALAVTVFFYVQWTGIRENGILGYVDHLMGSPRDLVGWIMVPLNFPLHILEELIRPLSLSLRLFGNILGEDSLIAAFVVLGISALAFFHIPVGLPLQFPFMMLALLTGTIQAVVFALLSTIYISLMLPHHEEAHH